MEEACPVIEASSVNGLILGDHFLSTEVVSHILTWADFDTLTKCRLVCRQWNQLVCDPFLWKAKMLREGRGWPRTLPRAMPWIFLAAVYQKQILEKNLIKNPSGKGRFCELHQFSFTRFYFPGYLQVLIQALLSIMLLHLLTAQQ